MSTGFYIYFPCLLKIKYTSVAHFFKNVFSRQSYDLDPARRMLRSMLWFKKKQTILYIFFPERKRLLEENERLRQVLVCKICMDNDANVVFTPCGHMVSCMQCSQKLKKCAICRRKIKGSIRAFQSWKPTGGRSLVVVCNNRVVDGKTAASVSRPGSSTDVSSVSYLWSLL